MAQHGVPDLCSGTRDRDAGCSVHEDTSHPRGRGRDSRCTAGLSRPVPGRLFKPRGEWHTFFNAADEPARLLELISPGGLEEAVRIIDTASDDFDLGAVIAPYGCEGDFEATMPIIEKYGLTFG